MIIFNIPFSILGWLIAFCSNISHDPALFRTTGPLNRIKRFGGSVKKYFLCILGFIGRIVEVIFSTSISATLLVSIYGRNRVGDHGSAMVIIGLLMSLPFMMQLQIWMQVTVLMMLLKVRAFIIRALTTTR